MPVRNTALRVAWIGLLFPAALTLAGAWAVDDDRFATLSNDDFRVIQSLVRSSPPKNAGGGGLFEVPRIELLPSELPQSVNKPLATAEGRLHAAIAAVNGNDPTRFADFLFKRRSDLRGLPVIRAGEAKLSDDEAAAFGYGVERVKSHFEKRLSELNTTNESLIWAWCSFLDDAERHDAALIAEGDGEVAKSLERGRIASLVQILATHPANSQMGLVSFLASSKDRQATRELARLVVFSENHAVRAAAIEALRNKQPEDYEPIISDALRYPYPPVAERAVFAIAKLRRRDWIEKLVRLKEAPDPRLPQQEGRQWVVRELVRIHHARNCLLCHPPAAAHSDLPAWAQAPLLAKGYAADCIKSLGQPAPTLSAAIATRSPGLGGFGGLGYGGFAAGPPIRFDITFLRQDFSLLMEDPDEKRRPPLQGHERFDFLVRRKLLTEIEARQYSETIRAASDGESPYHAAYTRAIEALRNDTRLGEKGEKSRRTMK